MKLLDTSTIIGLLRGDEQVTEKLSGEEDELATCFPVECELYSGTRMARNTEKGRKEVEALLEELTHLKSGRRAAEKFSELEQEYPEISEFDLMIAAVCITHGAGIITGDQDFKEIKELETEIL
jgi:predicted nucleic acid-binding protein